MSALSILFLLLAIAGGAGFVIWRYLVVKESDATIEAVPVLRHTLAKVVAGILVLDAMGLIALTLYVFYCEP